MEAHVSVVDGEGVPTSGQVADGARGPALGARPLFDAVAANRAPGRTPVRPGAARVLPAVAAVDGRAARSATPCGAAAGVAARPAIGAGVGAARTSSGPFLGRRREETGVPWRTAQLATGHDAAVLAQVVVFLGLTSERWTRKSHHGASESDPGTLVFLLNRP